MFIADHLFRASLKAAVKTQVFALELETLNSFDSIKITPERLTQVQKATAQDLETLKTTVVTGWPERKVQLPIQVRGFWNYREGISPPNGFLFKTQRVIVPKATRPEILSRIHSSHQSPCWEMFSMYRIKKPIMRVSQCSLTKFLTVVGVK